MKSYCLIFILLISYNKFIGQSFDYKLIYNDQGIQIFAKEIECHDNQNGIHQAFYALQFVNTTSENITISWNIDYWMNGACVTCSKPKNAENTYTLQLSPGQSYEGNCERNSIRGTKIYIRELYNSKSAALSKFELVNVTVNFN
ncbi:MAG: hypothetical protein N2449_07100 [Bacteroidales bacterium]|nr:hypothetical protein [Bacteroidales bacterium]